MPLLETPISPTAPDVAAKNNPSVNVQTAEVPSGKYFNDWPNDAAFHSSTEPREKRQLKVTGKFPSYTAGRLFRTGPQAAKAGDFTLDHWFDGFATVHRFDLEPNMATGDLDVHYAAKGQVDKLMEEARKNKKLGGISFAQKRDPCDTYFKKVKSIFKSSKPNAEPNINVTIQRKPGDANGANSLTLTTDAQMTRDFDVDTLEPKGVTNQRSLHPDLTGPMSAAHASFDPVTGDIFNFNLDLGPKATYRVFKTDAKTGKTEILAKFSDKSIPGVYIHSMFITENFVILCCWPATYANMGLSIMWENNLLDALKFDESASCHWMVVDRRHGAGLVKHFTSPAMFSFHTTNAFETSSGGSNGTVDIVCELVQHPNIDVIHKLYYKNVMSSGSGAAEWSLKNNPHMAPKLVRYTLAGVPVGTAGRKGSNPISSTSEAKVTASHAAGGELPTINPAYATKPHRYVYGVLETGVASFADSIVKTDAQTGEAIVWQTLKHSPGEPIFIARPGGVAEDDGVLLSVVLDGPREVSYLLCLDAKDLSEVARAEVEMPVTLGFHGAFLERK